MVRQTMVLQAKLQVFFVWQSAVVVNHPMRCIMTTVIWMNMVLPGAFLGKVELRNEEVLLPQDARELEAQTKIRGHFGPDWGQVSLIMTPSGGGDMLTASNLQRVANTESAMLALTAKDPDDSTKGPYTFADACERQFTAYPDGTAGPCFYMSILGPDTPWNMRANSTAKYVDAATSYQNLLAYASSLSAANPSSSVSGIHLAVTKYYAAAKRNMFAAGVLGTVRQHATEMLDGTPVVTGLTHLFFTAFLDGVERKTLVFDVWDLVTWDLPSLKPSERWEREVLDWAEKNPTINGLTIFRSATSSTSTEMLMMILWSVRIPAFPLLANNISWHSTFPVRTGASGVHHNYNDVQLCGLRLAAPDEGRL